MGDPPPTTPFAPPGPSGDFPPEVEFPSPRSMVLNADDTASSSETYGFARPTRPFTSTLWRRPSPPFRSSGYCSLNMSDRESIPAGAGAGAGWSLGGDGPRGGDVDGALGGDPRRGRCSCSCCCCIASKVAIASGEIPLIAPLFASTPCLDGDPSGFRPPVGEPFRPPGPACACAASSAASGFAPPAPFCDARNSIAAAAAACCCDCNIAAAAVAGSNPTALMLKPEEPSNECRDPAAASPKPFAKEAPFTGTDTARWSALNPPNPPAPSAASAAAPPANAFAAWFAARSVVEPW